MWPPCRSLLGPGHSGTPVGGLRNPHLALPGGPPNRRLPLIRRGGGSFVALWRSTTRSGRPRQIERSGNDASSGSQPLRRSPSQRIGSYPCTSASAKLLRGFNGQIQVLVEGGDQLPPRRRKTSSAEDRDAGGVAAKPVTRLAITEHTSSASFTPRALSSDGSTRFTTTIIWAVVTSRTSSPALLSASRTVPRALRLSNDVACSSSVQVR